MTFASLPNVEFRQTLSCYLLGLRNLFLNELKVQKISGKILSQDPKRKKVYARLFCKNCSAGTRSEVLF